ncbi:MBL fold metallo-hydrolase [Desulfatitalea tepidiphila]|uniref:MBL fold metallo-hydrolase n=1 Tax=Desulfatitalea tepidiphila TaxID=1185843 RepID=UPI0006B507EA|nr:MBL fold metallo-hydrolase [Desulfatitalea tepidiphila]
MIQEIGPDLFVIQVPLPNSPLKYLNSYVVRAKDRHLVIDTGLNRRACYDALTGGLHELGVELDKTDFFITHLHADHFGLVSRLVTESSRVYFNRPDAEIVEAKGWWEPMLAYAGLHGFPDGQLRKAIEQHPGYKHSSEWIPDMRMLNDGDVIEAGNYRFECVQTPGHTVGHTCLYDREKKIFVAGDHILIDITPNIQCWSDAHNPLGSYLKSLDRVRELEIDLTLPGHRRLIEDHRTRIEELMTHHQHRCNEILNILETEMLSAYDVAARMTWDIKCDSWEEFPIAQKWFATGEAISHLRYLEELGNIRRESNNGRVLFTVS